MPWADAARRAAKTTIAAGCSVSGSMRGVRCGCGAGRGDENSEQRAEIGWIHKPSGGASDQGDCSP